MSGARAETAAASDPTTGESEPRERTMPVVEHSYQVRLRPVSTAPRTARDVLAAVCVAWDAPGFLESGRLVLSELVSNAVIHNAVVNSAAVNSAVINNAVMDDGGKSGAETTEGTGVETDPAVGLELSLRNGEMLMRVHDEGADLPRMAAPPQGAAGGHGLGIVSRLTESWGVDVDAHGSGKTVWCVLRERPAGSGGPSSSD